MVHLYNGTLLRHKKECIWVSCSEVNEPRASDTEWSKSEREKQVLYINAIYIESRKMVLMILVENRLVGTEGEGERGTNWESSINIYTQSCKIDSGNLLNIIRNPAWCSVMT